MLGKTLRDLYTGMLRDDEVEGNTLTGWLRALFHPGRNT